MDSDTAYASSEAPRPVGRSESPVVPKNLVGAGSPGISDLPDIVAHAEGQPSAEGAPCIGTDGDWPFQDHCALMMQLAVAVSRRMMQV